MPATGQTPQVPISARHAGCTPNNQLQRIEFARLASATVEVPVTPPATFSAPGAVVLSSHPASIGLALHRVTARQPATVEMIVTDGFGT